MNKLETAGYDLNETCGRNRRLCIIAHSLASPDTCDNVYPNGVSTPLLILSPDSTMHANGPGILGPAWPQPAR